MACRAAARSRVVAIRQALCGFILIGVAAPPQPGLEVGGNVGRGSYTSEGCETPRTVYRETTFAAKVRYRDPETGASVGVDGSLSSASPSSGAGPHQTALSVAARGGGHWAYGGFELGGAIVRFDRDGDDLRASVVPSGLVWLGVPEFHALTTLAADRVATGFPDVTVGLGHSSRYLALQAGLGMQGYSADLELRVFKTVAPVVSLRVNHGDWNVAVGAAFHFEPF